MKFPITIDDCDSCIIGTDGTRAVYCYDKLVALFEKKFGDYTEAVEWVQINIIGAYYGEENPIVVKLFENN